MQLFQNPIFLTIVFAGMGAQLIKFVLYAIRFRTLHPLDLIATGGMPSSHVALMSGITTSIVLTEGTTTVFFVAFAISLIVIVDALGVRRTAGEEGLLLHKLIAKAKLNIKEPHISLGHTPSQVIVGVLLGVVVAILVSLAV